MLSKICPACGKDDFSLPFVGAFCRDCFVSRSPLYVLPSVSLQYCPCCGKFRLSGEWKDASFLKGFLQQRIKSDYELKDVAVVFDIHRKDVIFSVKLKLDVHGTIVEANDKARFVLDKRSCASCSRQAGGYHEAVLQLRGPKDLVALKAESIERKLKGLTFIAKVVKQKNGLDLLVGDKRILAQFLHGSGYVFSNKLVGRRDGRNLYRATFCLRL
ncbi:hypothetical protein HZC09_06760 [Candidatus Micrarchaeota archaeon]|nr:hypothetical protein [Candidatus Micrarchaeota archaeon]